MKIPLYGAAMMAVLAAPAWGLGIRIPDQDPLATARGNAFVATADNPSAIYYNPAGISQLEGHNVRVGLYGLTYGSEAASAFGGNFETEDEFAAVPQLYYTYTFKDSPFSMGLGVYSPYGLSLEWPDQTPWRQLGIFGSIQYLSVNPVMSFKVTDSLSLAFGMTVNHAGAELRNGVSPAPATDTLSFEGDGWAPGFNLGLLWKITEQHVVGLSYRSQTTIDLKGDSFATGAPFTSPAAATFVFPQHVVVGYSFRPTPKWNFEVNVDWTDWDALNSVTLVQPLYGNVTLPFNWQSSFFYEFGVTRTFDNGYRVSGGYIFSENSVPESSFNPIVPDSDRHIFSVGVGRTYESGWSWDAAYQFAYGPERTVANPLFIPSALGNGTYEFMSHAFSISVGKQFR